LEKLVERKRQILDGKHGREGDRLRPIRLRQGVIQAAVLDVLAAASGSLGVGEIQLQVEKRVGRSVSRHTVTSFLSVACRAGAPVVVRTGRGRYKLARRAYGCVGLR